MVWLCKKDGSGNIAKSYGKISSRWQKTKRRSGQRWIDSVKRVVREIRYRFEDVLREEAWKYRENREA